MKIKIVSLNLWNGGRLFAPMRDFLVDQQADIYCLQEVYDGHDDQLEDRYRTVELLKAAFPDYMAYFAPVYADTRVDGDIEEGNFILSRFPLIERENFFIDVPFARLSQDNTTDFSGFPSPLQRVVMEVGGKKLTLMNVHGPVNHNGTEDTPRRLHLRDRILERVTEYTIVAGDFNLQPQTQTISGLEAKLQTVFVHDRGTSFNLSRKDLVKYPGYATAVVDMMFATPSLRVLSGEMPQVDVSDHLPLVAELNF